MQNAKNVSKKNRPKIRNKVPNATAKYGILLKWTSGWVFDILLLFKKGDPYV